MSVEEKVIETIYTYTCDICGRKEERTSPNGKKRPPIGWKEECVHSAVDTVKNDICSHCHSVRSKTKEELFEIIDFYLMLASKQASKADIDSIRIELKRRIAEGGI